MKDDKLFNVGGKMFSQILKEANQVSESSSSSVDDAFGDWWDEGLKTGNKQLERIKTTDAKNRQIEIARKALIDYSKSAMTFLQKTQILAKDKDPKKAVLYGMQESGQFNRTVESVAFSFGELAAYLKDEK